jgi:hypothetical protein
MSLFATDHEFQDFEDERFGPHSVPKPKPRSQPRAATFTDDDNAAPAGSGITCANGHVMWGMNAPLKSGACRMCHRMAARRFNAKRKSK